MSDKSDAPKHCGWYYRNLPHCDMPELFQMVTFRMADSLPAEKFEEWKLALKSETDSEIRAKLEEYLDTGHGSCCLRDSRIARVVEDALLHFHGTRYNMIAWVVMPNHVHVLFECVEGHSLSAVVQSWKSFTSKEANKFLKRTGVFWESEYFDRFMRSHAHLVYSVKYIHENPVKAGLCYRPEEYLFSSARRIRDAAR